MHKYCISFSGSSSYNHLRFRRWSFARQCRVQERDIYFAFIDLTEEFDSVNRDALRGCLSVNSETRSRQGSAHHILYRGWPIPGAKSKVKTVTIVDLQYAYDCAVVAHSAHDLQNALDVLVEAYMRCVFSVNATNTKTLHQTTQPLATPSPNSVIECTTSDYLGHFTYIGSNIFNLSSMCTCPSWKTEWMCLQ